MKFHLRRAAAVVLAATLSLSSAAIAAPRPRDRDGEKVDRLVQVVKKIQRLFGISSNDDGLVPPVPPPAPPPNP